MKISIVVSTQPARFEALAYKGELARNVAMIADLGYEGVELAVRDPKLLDVDELERLIKAHGLEVPAIGTGQAYGEEGLSFTHPDPDVRLRAIERIKDQCDLAARFGALVILGLIRGKVEAGVERGKALTWLTEALREVCAYGAERDVRLVLEPINRYETNLVNTVAEGLELIEQVGADNLGLLLDTFHMNIEEPSIEAGVASAGERLLHFHVADSNRWYPGAGHINFAGIISALRRMGYGGYLSAEILPLPDPDTCARLALENLWKLVAGKMFEITTGEISVDEVVSRVTKRSTGAVVAFVGTVRGFTEDREVLHLEYEAYRGMAEKELRRIGDEIRSRWENIENVAIVHRIGHLEVGETIVVIALSAAHREGVFEAARYAIDRLKEIVPIWKKEVWRGGEAWIAGS
jgi:molybdopterin synthase catalytic subunit/hydroxypyruvate isomerase